MIRQYNTATEQWETVLPLPYYHSIIPGMWKRLTGWRDEYGRKAAITWAFWERDF